VGASAKTRPAVADDKSDEGDKIISNRKKLREGKAQAPIPVAEVSKIEISSDEGDEGDKIISNRTLDSAQKLLLRKGRTLRDILFADSTDECLITYEKSKNEMVNILDALSAEPIAVVDENSAEARIHQWQMQETQCDKFRIAAESYNLLHLASLVKIYEDLLKIGDKLALDSKNSVKSAKTWVIGFMRAVLGINSKSEQRNRLGCNRLRKLLSEGITITQLAQAGCRKCDFFAKQENYDIFLSQVPLIETRWSNQSNSSDERLSEILSLSTTDAFIQRKRGVTFKLSLGEDLRNIADKYNDDDYIVS
jgi:hypothetical protein